MSQQAYTAAENDFSEEDFQWPVDIYRRKPQPWYWRKLLEERDGVASGSSVVVYQSTVAGCHGLILDVERRETFEQAVPEERREREVFGIVADSPLVILPRHDKEMMIVVKRGNGIDSAEKREPPLFHNLSGEDEGISWQDVRSLREDEDEYGLVEEDVYKDVEEFVRTWPNSPLQNEE